MSSEWTVAELLKRCSRRPSDDAAWQEFVRRYHSTIRANVVKTFHRKSKEEQDRKPQFTEDQIDDLVQAVYMRLVEDQNRALERFEGGYANSIYQYLAMISINVVRDHFREVRAQKRPKISFSLDELMEKSGEGVFYDQAITHIDGSQVLGAEMSLTMDEIDALLKKAASGRNRDRDVLIFKLRFYEGMTLDEINKTLRLGLSPISIGSIINRMTVKLRRILEARSRRR